MSDVAYDPTIFLVPRNLEQASQIALTAEDTTTERRWKIETPYLVDLMLDHIDVGTITRVLDFGCGPGRIAKELIARTGCRVFGVDISPAMRAIATGYVESPYFLTCDPEMMVCLPRMNAAVAVWAIQHAAEPEKEIMRISSMLAPKGRLFVVSSRHQVLPIANYKWLINNDVDMHRLFKKHMKEVAYDGALDTSATSPAISENSWWGVFEPLN